MAERNRHIDDIFRDQLGSYSEVPDASVWDNIEAGLDGKAASPADGGDTGGTSGGSGISAGHILLILTIGAALFFTARWAIGHLGKNKNDQKNAITITKTESLPPAAIPSTEVQPNNTEEPPTETTPTNQPDVSENAKASASPRNLLTGNEPRKARKQKSQVAATVAANTPSAKPIQNTTAASPSGPSVLAPAVLSPAITKQLRKQEQIDALEPVLPQPELPVTLKTLRLKENMSRLYFNSSIRMLASADMPDVDYGMMDPSGGVQRFLENIRKNLLSGTVEAGIKGGIEAGFQKYSAVKLAISPYVQYSFSPRMSILLQPGFKFGRLTRTEIIPKSSYYSITNETVTANHIVIPSADSNMPDEIIRRYYYTETYDSLNIGYNTASKGLFEFELPILLQFKVDEKFSVYGGVNINFSKTVRIKENKTVYAGVSHTDSVLYPKTSANTPSPDPPPVDNMFSHTAKPYGQYGSQLWQNPANDPLKIGYMLGVSYQLKERVRLDVMMQQNLSNQGYIINKDIRSIHAQPYFRVTVGYRLFKNK